MLASCMRWAVFKTFFTVGFFSFSWSAVRVYCTDDLFPVLNWHGHYDHNIAHTSFWIPLSDETILPFLAVVHQHHSFVLVCPKWRTSTHIQSGFPFHLLINLYSIIHTHSVSKTTSRLMLARTQQCTGQLHAPLRSEDVSRFGIVCNSLFTLFHMKMGVCMNRAGWSLLNFHSVGGHENVSWRSNALAEHYSPDLLTVVLWLKGVSLDWNWEKGHALFIVESTKTVFITGQM